MYRPDGGELLGVPIVCFGVVSVDANVSRVAPLLFFSSRLFTVGAFFFVYGVGCLHRPRQLVNHLRYATHTELKMW